MTTKLEGTITELAATRWGTAHNARLAKVMQALVRHLHDLAREVRLTTPDGGKCEVPWLLAAHDFVLQPLTT